jgi:hypothetical protein
MLLVARRNASLEIEHPNRKLLAACALQKIPHTAVHA